MSQTKQINGGLFSRLKDSGSGKAFKQVVSNFHSEESTAGQTIINLPYVVEQANIDNFLLFVDGIKLSRDDFDFINIISDKSNEIQLKSPLADGLEIEALLAGVAISKANLLTLESQVRDLSDNIAEWARNGFESHISAELIDAPFTTIQNREKIPSGLDTGMGIERIHFDSISQLADESGPNGESVYELDSKDVRVRLIGTWNKASSNGGFLLAPANPNNQIEVVFYGTGLNYFYQNDGNPREAEVSVDGGAFGSNLLPTNPSSVLNSRNYAVRCLVNAVSGLPLGWHTARIRDNSAFELLAQGIEILNESSQVIAASGSGFAGTKKQSLSGQTAIDYKPAAMTGTNGGRVSTYLLNGQLEQSFTEVPATPSYLSSTDHSNEELVRAINFREFGANRSDDFSTLTTSFSDRAFTLDDGTTTLIGDDVFSNTQNNIEGMRGSTTGDSYTITFVGTGLDVFWSVGNVDDEVIEVIIDGVSVGFAGTGRSDEAYIGSVCSGLPYGTHTVRFTRSVSGSSNRCAVDFLIYQPKKPSIPSDALELADYNVLADFVQIASPNPYEIAQGVIRKANVREFVYSGSWVITAAANPAAQETIGYEIGSTTSGDYQELTFMGTGFDLRGEERPATHNATLNGVPLTSANFPTATAFNTGSTTFNLSTGVFGSGSSGGNGQSAGVRDLPFGKYTLRLTKNDTTSTYNDAIDVITPIHINDISLKIGSQSLKAQKNISPVAKEETAPSVGEAKALLVFDTINNAILSSYNVAAVIDSGTTGRSIIHFTKPFKTGNNVMAGSSAGGLFLESLASTPSYHTIGIRRHDNATVDQVMRVAFFGELVDEE